MGSRSARGSACLAQLLRSHSMSDTQPIHRLGVIGDIHAECDRLDAVLDWLAGQQLDASVCTGDIADGKGCMNRCCDLLKQAAVATVAGNHDRWLLQDRVRHLVDAHQLGDLLPATQEYLMELPKTRELQTVSGSLLLCHGVGDNDLGKVWPGTVRTQAERSAELDKIIDSGEFKYLVNGHLHYRVLIDFTDLLLVNAGTLRGEFPGVSIIDFDEGWIAAYELDLDAGRQRIKKVAEYSIDDRTGRRIWENTQAFDAQWTPSTLYA